MKTFFYRIFHSEFLTFNEVLRLKVLIVNAFLIAFVFLSIPISTFNSFNTLFDLIVPISFTVLLVLTFVFTVANFNRLAMHTSIWTISLLTLFYVTTSGSFFSYMLFFVSLTIIIFYQDVVTYLVYGGVITLGGVVYVLLMGDTLVGINSLGENLSSLTYQVILVAFYLVFFIQFLVSDNLYEKLNNEWVRMNKTLEKYQQFTHTYLVNIIDKNKQTPIYDNIDFQKSVNEISCFINDFFEEDGDDIAEVVEFYFFLHSQEVDDVIKDEKLPILTRKYANELKKYLLNYRSELVSMLFDFSTLFNKDKEYDDLRYEYNLDELFPNRVDKLLSLAILYKFLKTEITQFDKWGQIDRVLTHEEITEMFISVEFREFISFEQVNFFLDNQELFEKHL